MHLHLQTIDRIGQFEEALHNGGAAPGSEPAPRIARPPLVDAPAGAADATDGNAAAAASGALLRVESLTLAPPRAAASSPPLIRDLSFTVRPGEHLLIMGRSGSGKTSLLRALGGLWTAGAGAVALAGGVPTTDERGDEAPPRLSPRDVFFLPQKPYLVLGSLRQQLLYPLWADAAHLTHADGGAAAAEATKPSADAAPAAAAASPPLPPAPDDDALAAALRAVSLGGLLERAGGLDAEADWSAVLSLGEQQRVAFARLLLSRPRLALLDESSSALDGEAEAAAYAALRAAGTTYVSVGHRDSLRAFHTRLLRLGDANGDGGAEASGWALLPLAGGAPGGETLTREA
jgi:ABC-type uncharacterized transport system fused permease/ATPase subunit